MFKRASLQSLESANSRWTWRGQRPRRATASRLRIPSALSLGRSGNRLHDRAEGAGAMTNIPCGRSQSWQAKPGGSASITGVLGGLGGCPERSAVPCGLGAVGNVVASRWSCGSTSCPGPGACWHRPEAGGAPRRLLTLLDRSRSGRDCSPTWFRYAHYPRACKSRTSHQVKLSFGGGSPDETTVGGAWGASLGKWLRQRYCR